MLPELNKNVCFPDSLLTSDTIRVIISSEHNLQVFWTFSLT